MRLNAEAASGTWALGLYIDGTLRYTARVSGNRNRDLVRLPANIQGYTWRVVATYSLAAVPKVFGVEMMTQELRAA
jgi:hypothetical protein